MSSGRAKLLNDITAQRYGVSPERLAQDNGLADPARLVPGQTLVILYPGGWFGAARGDPGGHRREEGVTPKPAAAQQLRPGRGT